MFQNFDSARPKLLGCCLLKPLLPPISLFSFFSFSKHQIFMTTFNQVRSRPQAIMHTAIKTSRVRNEDSRWPWATACATSTTKVHRKMILDPMPRARHSANEALPHQEDFRQPRACIRINKAQLSALAGYLPQRHALKESGWCSHHCPMVILYY